MLSPFLYSLFTHDCVGMHASNSIIKFANDTTVVGLITKNDETDYREELRALRVWCQENNLSLNVNKTKEMIVEFRKQKREHPPYPHRWDCSGESGKFYVPRHTHHGQTEMVHPHRQRGEEDATVPRQPREAEEIWLVT